MSRGTLPLLGSVVVALPLTVLGVGCSLDGPVGERSRSAVPARVREAPREVAPLEGVDPVQILLVRGTPTDSDSDGYPDTIPALVYLFPDSEASALPVWAEGEFEFRLIDSDQRPVANWVFPPDMAEQSKRTLQPGPAYSFFLRLGGEDDKMEPVTLELSAVFRSSTGRRVTSQGSAAVRLGAR